MEFIRRKLSRAARTLIYCFLISLIIILLYYLVHNMNSNEAFIKSFSTTSTRFPSVLTPDPRASTPAARMQTLAPRGSTPAPKKRTKHKKTLEKVLARADKRRAMLVKTECSCSSRNNSYIQDSILKTNNMQCMKKQYPKALVVGMTKGGTTALMSFLNEHPKIAARIVRPFDTRYFNHYYEKPYDWYRNLMPCSYPNQITISRSTEYFFTSNVPERIKKFDPSMKIIIIVREPVVRALSQFVMWKFQAEYRIGNMSFEDAVTTGTSKEVDPLSRLIVVSDYQRHMKVWLKYFNLKQILILDSVTFLNDPVQELNKVEDFLGIERFFTQNNFVFNANRDKYCLASSGGEVKCQSKKKGIPHPAIEESLKIKLQNYFRPRNQMFFKLINRNFDWGY